MNVVDRAGFEREVVDGSDACPVVVDFWAPWCGPCRVLGPRLERLEAADAGRWKLVKVDVEAHPQLGELFGVEGIPAVFGFRDGQVVARFVGALPEAQVRQWLDRLLPTPADEAVAAADLARSQGDLELATAELERALSTEPDHAVALAMLAELARLPPR